MKQEKDAILDELAAKQALRDINNTYCRAVDRCDEELLKTIWHEDATVKYGIFDGLAMEFCSFVIDTLKTMERTFHSVSNEFFKVEGAKAQGETYVIAVTTAEVDGEIFDGLLGGRYLDRFECREGVWKIAHRTLVMDWNMTQPATAVWDEGMYAQITTRGRPSHEDPVYALWEGR